MILPSAHLGEKITWACGKLNSNRKYESKFNTHFRNGKSIFWSTYLKINELSGLNITNLNITQPHLNTVELR